MDRQKDVAFPSHSEVLAEALGYAIWAADVESGGGGVLEVSAAERCCLRRVR